MTVPLVGGDGIYQVRVGLRGLPADAQPTWLEAGLTLDTRPPVVTLTNPIAGTVSTPMIQVQGFANETLGSLTFDVRNASGWFPDQAGYVVRQAYDTNLLKFTTNWFQCYDVPLTNGVNVITLHATDLAGNTATSNVSCTLNYAGVSNAPVLAVIWPPDGTRVAAGQFTLQAQVDDATATVTATVNGHAVPGQIERSGQVWLPGLSLNSGTNVVTITAVNGAGNRSSTNLSVIGSAAGLTVAPLAGQLNQPTVTVTGTVADPDDQVTVNGVAGYVYDAAGDWLAYGVPVNVTGTADLNVALTDDDFNPLGELKVGQPQPAMIALMSYQSSAHDAYTGVGEGDGHEDESYIWDYLSGGREQGDIFLENQGDDDIDYNFDGPIPAGLGTFEAYADSPVYENISAAGTFNNVLPYYSSFLGTYGPYSQQTQAQLMIVPSGQGLLGTTRLYLVSLSAMSFSDPLEARYIRQAGDVPVDPTTLQVNGQPLTRSGHTNADGSMTGLALVAGPAGAPVPLTVTSSAAVNYSFATNRLQEISLQSLTVVSNSATQIDGTNWAVVKSAATNDYVIVQATLNDTNDWVLTRAAPLIQWSGGEAVSGKPFQRRVAKANSVETTVTASLGSTTTNLNVWVIWATVQILTSGTNPPPPFPQYPSSIDNGAPILGPRTNSAGDVAWGKITAVAQILPVGVHNIITNGWVFKREKMRRDFIDGVALGFR